MVCTGFPVSVMCLRREKASSFMFTIRFLDFKLIYKNRKIILSQDEFCWIPRIELLSDSKKTEEKKEEQKEKLVKGVLVFLSAALCLAAAAWLADRILSEGRYLGMALFSLCMIPIIAVFGYLLQLISYMGNSPMARLRRKNKRIITAILKRGIRPSAFEDELMEDWELNAGSDNALHMYTYLQYFCALDLGDVERVYHLAHRLGAALPQPKGMILSYFNGICGELVFYYSYVERNPELANYFKSRFVPPYTIEDDMDLNGRRIYAYYLYGNGGEAEEILRVIEEGLAVAGSFSTPGNIPMEVGLLEYLKELVLSDGEGTDV